MPCLPAYTWSVGSFERVSGSKKRLLCWQRWVFPLTVDFRDSVRLRDFRYMFSSLYRETEGKKMHSCQNVAHSWNVILWMLIWKAVLRILGFPPDSVFFPKSCWSVSFVFMCSFKMTCFRVMSLLVVEIRYWWVHEFLLVSCFKYLQLRVVFHFRLEF